MHEIFKTAGVGIRVEGVSKSYHTAAEEVHALKRVDWEVAAGQGLAIIGPSGCGKTTLLNLLGGIDRPSEGSIRVGEEEVSGAGERELERHRLLRVGFIFQFFNLIPTLSALENVALPLLIAGVGQKEREERARTLLGMMELEHKADKRPEELSGGQQQRVAIAVALSNDPALLLADEPTGNLDSDTGKTVATLLYSLAADHGKTVIMVSHDPRAVAMFPQVLAMRDGRFVNGAATA